MRPTVPPRRLLGRERGDSRLTADPRHTAARLWSRPRVAGNRRTEERALGTFWEGVRTAYAFLFLSILVLAELEALNTLAEANHKNVSPEQVYGAIALGLVMLAVLALQEPSNAGESNQTP